VRTFALLGRLQRIARGAGLGPGRSMQGLHQPAQQLRRVDPELMGLIELGQRGGRIAGEHQLEQPPDAPAIGEAEHVADLVGRDLARTMRNRLVEDRQTVAGRAFGCPGDHPHRFGLDFDRPKSIGRVRGFTGPFGVFVRSYAYIRAYGPALRDMSEVAVLNANYLLARLKEAYDLPFDRLCMHEFVVSARTLKKEHGITALDVAKRLMDYGFHPPTIYFPLVVPEALMVEPTETEPKERLDEFCDAMLAIAREAADDPDVIREAPHDRPVRRLDEVRAAKRAIVRYGFEEHPDLSGEPVEPRQLEAQKGA